MFHRFSIVLFLFVLTAFSGAKAFAAASLPADLSVDIVSGGDTVAAGATFSYVIEVTNLGEIGATDTVLGLNLPSQGSLVSATFNGTDCVEVGSPTRLNCDLGLVNQAQIISVTVQWEAPDAGATLTLSADATTTETDAVTDNNTDTIDTVVTPPDDDDDNIDGGGGCSLSAAAAAVPVRASFLTAIIPVLGMAGLRLRKSR